MEQMNSDLNEVSNWLNKNKLKLNINKTKWMLISKDNSNPEMSRISIMLEGKMIERVATTKYLGITLNEKMNFDDQVKNCIKKTACKVNMLKRTARKLTFSTQKMLYNSFILSQFDYCSTIYLNINKEQMGEMQKIQNRAMRVLLNCERTTSKKHMLDKLKWLSVSQRIVLNSLMMIHKIKNNKGPEYLIEKVKFVGESHNRNTRSVNDFKLPIVKYEKSKKNLL